LEGGEGSYEEQVFPPAEYAGQRGRYQSDMSNLDRLGINLNRRSEYETWPMKRRFSGYQEYYK